MKAPPNAIAALHELLATGETADGAVSAVDEPLKLGLWSHDSPTARRATRAALAKLAARLPNEGEVIAAVFGCQPELRTAWVRIVAARLREAVKRRDAAELCRAIDLLDVASRRIREELPSASLQPTGYQALETALFGAPAEQAVVWPKLLRAIGATADLVEGGQGHPAPPLAPIEPLDTRTNWCAGRLLQLPRGSCGAGVPPAASHVRFSGKEEQAGRLHHKDGQAGRLHHNQEQAGRLEGEETELRFVLSGECAAGEEPSVAPTALTLALGC
jgi:hypothetical protein